MNKFAAQQEGRSAGRAAVAFASVATVILLATSAFHATGYSSIVRGVASLSASSLAKAAAPALWLFFSWHLVALALSILAAALTLKHSARSVLFACSFIVTIDLCWVLSIAGVFAGTGLLFTAALCTFAAASLSPKPPS